MEQNLLHCGIHRRRFFHGVGYSRRKTVPVWDTIGKNVSSSWGTTEEKFFKHPELFSGVSHTGGKPLLLYYTLEKKSVPLYPTTEENFFSCIPHRKKN
jgi:hypothetical protein